MFCCPMKRWICSTCCMFYCLLVSIGYSQNQVGEVYFDLGVFAFEDKDFNTAKQYLRKAYQLNPDNPFYCHFLGKFYLTLDQLDTAEKYLKKAYEINPVLNELEYDLAYLTFKRGNYQDAAHQFITIVEKDPFIQNVPACYYAGISLFQCQKYQKAIDYLMSASRRSPTMQANCMFYCGISYYKMNRPLDAVRCFENVFMSATDPLKSYAKNWLISLRRKNDDKKKFDALIKLSVSYDNNVMIVTPDLITGDEADNVLQCYLSGKYSWQWMPTHQLGLGMRHYQTFHQDLSEFDLTGSVIDLLYSYKLHEYTYQFYYSPSVYWLERYRYMFRHRLKASVYWPMIRNLTNYVAYSFDIIENFNNEQRDGNTHEFSMDLCYYIKPYHMKILAGFSAQSNQRKNFLYQYDEISYRLRFIYKLMRDLRWQISLNFHQRRYDIWEEVKRKDNRIDFSFSLSYPFYQDGLEVAIEYDYSKNNTRQDQLDPFDYRRNVYGISLIYYY